MDLTYTITETFRAVVNNTLTIVCENRIDPEGKKNAMISVRCGIPMEKFVSTYLANEARWLSRSDFEEFVARYLVKHRSDVEAKIEEFGGAGLVLPD